MSESPNWLSTSAPAPSDPAPATKVDPLSIESSTEGAAAGTAAAATNEKDLPSIILMMRLLNMGAAVGLITAAVSSERMIRSLNNEGFYFERIVFPEDISS